MIDIFLQHRDLLMRYALKLTDGREEVAEDALSLLAYRLLNSSNHREINRAYLISATKFIIVNFARRHKITANASYSFLERNLPDNDFEADLIDNIAIKEIAAVADKHLTRKKRTAVMDMLNGKELASNDPSYESAKTHRRRGAEELQTLLKINEKLSFQK